MFTVDEIRNQVIEALKAEGIDAETRDVFKNGVMLHGVMAKGEIVSPTIYVDENTYVSKAVEALKKAIAEAPDFGGDPLLALDLDNVTLYVTSGEADGVITRQLLGGVSYGVSIPIKGFESGYVKLKNEIVERFGMSADDLFARASANMHQSANIKSLASVIAEIMGGCASEDEFETPMFVASTGDRTQGGALLTDTALLESFRKEHGDFWIIPSSIHELIFVPCDKADGEALEPMIGEVNGTCVSPEERLSNNLFKFDENGLTVFEG